MSSRQSFGKLRALPLGCHLVYHWPIPGFRDRFALTGCKRGCWSEAADSSVPVCSQPREGAADSKMQLYSPANFCASSSGVAAAMALYSTPG